MSIDIQLNNALSKQNIRVNVPSTFTIGITTDADKMGNAAERLLGMNNAQMTQLAKEIIFGQMRLVVATMRIEEINSARDLLIEAITNNVSTELEKVGLRLINVNIQDVTDESGYIEALGKEASAKAIADAKISVAQAERDSEIGKAAADKEMSISVATAQAESTKGKNDAQMQIAQSSSDLRIKQAEAARIAQVAENLAKADIDRQTFEAAATAQQSRADMQRKQQYAEQVVPAEIAKQAAVVHAEAEAQRLDEQVGEKRTRQAQQIMRVMRPARRQRGIPGRIARIEGRQGGDQHDRERDLAEASHLRQAAAEEFLGAGGKQIGETGCAAARLRHGAWRRAKA